MKKVRVNPARRARFEAKHPELVEKYRVKDGHANRVAKTHGMASEDYDYFVRVQRGRCAICQRTAEEAKQRHLSVDHCHQTGRARGLLCGQCNWTVGMIKEDAATARRLLAYIENRCLPAKAAGVLVWLKFFLERTIARDKISMTVYIVVAEHWDETDILGVYASLEAAKASAPNATWVRSGERVELDGELGPGRRVVIQSHDVV